MTKRLISKAGIIKLIASRRETNRFLNENFRDYLADQLHNNHELSLEVYIKTPYEEKALQAVDIASWAIFRKYEYNDESFYRLLESILVEENALYK